MMPCRWSATAGAAILAAGFGWAQICRDDHGEDSGCCSAGCSSLLEESGAVRALQTQPAGSGFRLLELQVLLMPPWLVAAWMDLGSACCCANGEKGGDGAAWVADWMRGGLAVRARQGEKMAAGGSAAMERSCGWVGEEKKVGISS